MPDFVTAWSEDQGSNTTWTATNQGGFDDGDTLLMHVVTNSDHAISAGPAGFTQVGTTQTDAGVDSSASLFVKVADGEPGSWAVTFLASELGVVTVVAFAGVNPAHLIAGTSDWFAQAASVSASQSGPSVTPDEDYSTIVQFVSTDPNGAYTGDPDSSPVATELVDHIFNADAYVFVQSYLQATAAAIALDATISSSDGFARFQVALAPGPVQVELRLSGGASNDDPLLSFGGVESSAVADDVWEDVTRETADVGLVDYRLVYVHNTDVARSATVLAWVTDQLPGTMAFAIGVATEAAGGTVTAPADRVSAPAGVVFTSPLAVEDAVDLGTIDAGEARGLWLRRTIDPVTAAAPGNAWQVTVQVTTL